MPGDSPPVTHVHSMSSRSGRHERHERQSGGASTQCESGVEMQYK